MFFLFKIDIQNFCVLIQLEFQAGVSCEISHSRFQCEQLCFIGSQKNSGRTNGYRAIYFSRIPINIVTRL